MKNNKKGILRTVKWTMGFIFFLVGFGIQTIHSTPVVEQDIGGIVKREIGKYLKSNKLQNPIYQLTEMEDTWVQQLFSDAGTTSGGAGAEADSEVVEHDYKPFVFIVVALLIGAATRHVLAKIELPFTVALLLIGIGLGILGRMDFFGMWHILNFKFDTSLMEQSIHWAAHIDPHLILYIFLPILIFEATFAIDVHVFKKSFFNSVLLAVPGILISIIVTSGLIWLLIIFNVGLDSWYWEITLLLGTVISATDPVAVVSILKDLGASKKLSTLIEGESLLNDGVAIVIFMVIFMGISGKGIEHAPLLEFVRVAFGGIGIGLIVGGIALFWIKRVMNDVLIEISIIVASAYLTFFICEYAFHVSGVLGTVSLGILMAGPGRTRISPGVQHFIHEFWELAAFVANTLIFLIVGVVIAERTVFVGSDIIILFLIYAIIHVARVISQVSLYPVMKRSGYGISLRDSKILWWGALRGAIGLALALMVEANHDIDKTIRDEFLFLTAGIVTLTLLINATTMKRMAAWLGMTQISPTKEYARDRARRIVFEKSKRTLQKMEGNKFFKTVDWKKVKKAITFGHRTVDLKKEESKPYLEEARERLLEKEKSQYWTEFKEGLINAEAYELMVTEIDEIIDSKGTRSLSDRADLEKLLSLKNKLIQYNKLKVIGPIIDRLYTNRLYTCFNAAKGFHGAQEEALALVREMWETANESEKEVLHKLEAEIKENIIESLTFLRKFKVEFPILHEKISTQQASVTLLNGEIKSLKQLVKQGRLSKEETYKMIADIEARIREIRSTNF